MKTKTNFCYQIRRIVRGKEREFLKIKLRVSEKLSKINQQGLKLRKLWNKNRTS